MKPSGQSICFCLLVKKVLYVTVIYTTCLLVLMVVSFKLIINFRNNGMGVDEVSLGGRMVTVPASYTKGLGSQYSLAGWSCRTSFHNLESLHCIKVYKWYL